MNPSEWNASSNKAHLYNEVLRRSTERFFVCDCRFGTFKLRSALENVFLIEAHNCATVHRLSYERVWIPLLDGRKYKPDFLINNEYLVECKASRDQRKREVLEKAQAAQEFCIERDWLYQMLDFNDFSGFFALV